MGELSNLYSARKKRTFSYRLTCGKCRKTVPWEPYNIYKEGITCGS